MSLKAQINDDMKAAMRAKETARLSAIRLLLAAIKQKEVDERIDRHQLGCAGENDGREPDRSRHPQSSGYRRGARDQTERNNADEHRQNRGRATPKVL